MIESEVGFVIPTLGVNLIWLRQSLESVRKCSSECKIVVVSPSSDQALNALVNEHRADLIIQEPKGVFAAINAGVEYLSVLETKFFAFLGDDDVLVLENLSEMLAEFKDERVAVVYGKIWYVDENLNKKMINPGYPQLHFLMNWIPNLIPNPGTLIRVSYWKMLGGYDEKLRHAGDLDFWLKVRKVGRIRHIKKDIALFRWHSNSLTAGQQNSALQEASFVRNRNVHPSMRVLHARVDALATSLGEILRKFKWKNN